jgi:hypothetical protein
LAVGDAPSSGLTGGLPFESYGTPFSANEVALTANGIYDTCVKGLLRAGAENPVPRLGTGAGGASGATAYRSRRRESARAWDEWLGHKNDAQLERPFSF